MCNSCDNCVLLDDNKYKKGGVFIFWRLCIFPQHTPNFNDIHYICDEKLCNSRSTINNTLSTIPLAMRCDKHLSLSQLTMHEQQIAHQQQKHVILDHHHMYKFLFVCYYYCISHIRNTHMVVLCYLLFHIYPAQNSNNNNILSYMCVYTTTKKNGTCCLFSSQYPYHIFLMCVQFPHSQNNHRTHTHTRSYTELL